MLDELQEYICELDKHDKAIIDNKVAEKGIDEYLTQQLIYLDCSRLYKDGSRAMQTIGYPYQREITSYIYVLEKAVWLDGYQDKHKQEWTDKLLERHSANLEYERDNPPIWYGGKKAKAKWDKEHKDKHPRRRNVVQSTIPGMGKEISNVERLKRLSAQFGPLKFAIKVKK